MQCAAVGEEREKIVMTLGHLKAQDHGVCVVLTLVLAF